MYIYFNNQGILTTIIQHGDPVIRQGSTFELHLLFEEDCPYVHSGDVDSAITVRFKKAGEKIFGTEMYLERQFDLYHFEEIDGIDEVTFDLVYGKDYIHYIYYGTVYDSSKYGKLEAAFTVYEPKLIAFDTNNDGDTEDEGDTLSILPKDEPRVFTTGLATLYVERTSGVENSSNITLEQHAYLMALIGRLFNMITGGTGEIDVGLLKTHYVGSDLIPNESNRFHLGSQDLRWLNLYLENGVLSVNSSGHLIINEFDYREKIEQLTQEVFGDGSNGLSYIVRVNHEDRLDAIEATIAILDEVIKNRESLQSQIDAINAGQNLADIVADLTALNNYDTTNLQNGDKVQVLVDSGQDNASTVYNWNATTHEFEYIGRYGQDSYTKDESNNRFAPLSLSNLSQPSMSVLNQNITLFANDGSNNPIKISLDNVLQRFWRHENEMPNDMQDGQYIFLDINNN